MKPEIKSYSPKLSTPCILDRKCENENPAQTRTANQFRLAKLHARCVASRTDTWCRGVGVNMGGRVGSSKTHSALTNYACRRYSYGHLTWGFT